MAWKGPFLVSKEIAKDIFEILEMGAGVLTTYHQSKLRKYNHPDPEQSRLFPASAQLRVVDGRIEYEIEEILAHREVRGKRQYLLQWKNTPETTWE